MFVLTNNYFVKIAIKFRFDYSNESLAF